MSTQILVNASGAEIRRLARDHIPGIVGHPTHLLGALFNTASHDIDRYNIVVPPRKRRLITVSDETKEELGSISSSVGASYMEIVREILTQAKAKQAGCLSLSDGLDELTTIIAHMRAQLSSVK